MRATDVAESLLTLIPIVAAAGVISGVIRYRQLGTLQRVLAVYLLISLLTDRVGNLLGNILFDNNLILVPAFGLLELGLFAYLYIKCMLPGKSRSLGILVAVSLGFILLDIIRANPADPAGFHSYGRVLDGLTIVVLCLAYYWHVLRGHLPIDRTKVMLNSAVFLFFCANSLFFTVVNLVVTASSDLMIYLWIINALATPAFYIFLTYLLWQNGNAPKPSRSGLASRS